MPGKSPLAVPSKVAPKASLAAGPAFRTRIVLILLLLGGLSAGHLPAADEKALKDAFAKAIADAEKPEPDEIVRNLIAITPENQDVPRKLLHGKEAVLMSSWVSDFRPGMEFSAKPGVQGKPGDVVVLKREFWLTVSPQLQHYHRDHPDEFKGDTVLRLEQLLGLPPKFGMKKFIEVYVRPEAIFRPAADPEITDSEAEIGFRSSVSDAHRTWFKKMENDLRGKFPWTRLGYTYDWHKLVGHKPNEQKPERPVGISEFIVPAGVEVEIVTLLPTIEYLKLNQAP